MDASRPSNIDPRVAAKIAPPALAPAIIDPKPEWRIKFDHWMVNEGPKVPENEHSCTRGRKAGEAHERYRHPRSSRRVAQVLFALVWTAINAVLFFTAYVQYQFSPDYSSVRNVFGYGLPIVRACCTLDRKRPPCTDPNPGGRRSRPRPKGPWRRRRAQL